MGIRWGLVAAWLEGELGHKMFLEGGGQQERRQSLRDSSTCSWKTLESSMEILDCRSREG